MLTYFVLGGNVCALLATESHVYEGDPINRPALTELVRAIVANNRAGGWRRLSRRNAASP